MSALWFESDEASAKAKERGCSDDPQNNRFTVRRFKTPCLLSMSRIPSSQGAAVAVGVRGRSRLATVMLPKA